MSLRFTPERVEEMPDLIPLTHPRMPNTQYVPEWGGRRPSARQEAFMLLDWLPEVFFGGAAGGGKSDALLMAALQYVDRPGYNALILRRMYTQLAKPEALMFRAQQWLGQTDAVWSSQDHMWVFPSGATLSFGHMEHQGDELQYQSAAYQYIAFDEVTDFSEHMYTFMFSRLRRTAGSDVPLRMRSASNPTGPGKDWAQRRFITEGTAAGRVFIPSHLQDNPGLDVDEYVKSLGHLSASMQLRLLRGLWDVADDGSTFKRHMWVYVDPDEVPSGAKWCRYWDLAATEASRKPELKKVGDPDYTVGLLAAYRQGIMYVVDVVRDRKEPGGVEAMVQAAASKDGRVVPIVMEQEPGSSGKALPIHYRRTVVPGYTVRAVPSTGNKEVRAQPVAARQEAGEVRLVKAAWNGAFVDECAAFPDPRVHDDQVDALSGAYAFLAPMPPTAGPGGTVTPSHWRTALGG